MKKDTPFTIAGRTFNSRLLVGSGKYKDLEETKLATEASGSEIITVAIRRVNIGQNPNEESLLDAISPSKYTILPNTAGCFNAKDAVRTLLLARELLDGHNLVKLEVLGDEKTLYPNIVETLEASKILIKEGFDVMVYTSDDPIVAKELEEIGCCAIMPLASLIGSGQGLANPFNIKLIKDQASVPVLVDAGIGCASDAAKAMELGCDGVLMNSAIANADDPLLMASAMKYAIIAGRESYLAGRMLKKVYASASSPMENLI
jgi:thiazole synthase